MGDVGSGLPVVKAANWLTHLDLDWASPVWRNWNHSLASRYRHIRDDARGCGFSDRDLGDVDLTDVDVWVSDLEAVVDAAIVDDCVLLGMSQGAVPAIEFARRHPERVNRLVLYGAYARGMRRRGPDAARRADTLGAMLQDGWGGTNPAFRTVFTMTFLPESDSEQMRWFNDLQLASASADSALRLESAFHDVDISEAASELSVPTMVVHGRGDMATPDDQGRELAALIPDAEFVTRLGQPCASGRSAGLAALPRPPHQLHRRRHRLKTTRPRCHRNRGLVQFRVVIADSAMGSIRRPGCAQRRRGGRRPHGSPGGGLLRR